jgi:hypothetical protein
MSNAIKIKDPQEIIFSRRCKAQRLKGYQNPPHVQVHERLVTAPNCTNVDEIGDMSAFSASVKYATCVFSTRSWGSTPPASTKLFIINKIDS